MRSVIRSGAKGVSALCLGVLLAACRDDDAPSPPDEAFVAPSTAAPGAEGSFSETDAEVSGGGGSSARGDGGLADAGPGMGEAGLGEGNEGPLRDASAAPDASPPTGTGFGRDAQVDASP